MSITQLYPIDEFFDTVDPREFKLGQICWVPVPILDPIPRILDVQRNLPEEHEQVKFEIRLANEKNDFRRRDRSLPIKYLNLRSHEELLVQKGRKRPAIILSSGVDCYPEIEELLKRSDKKHQQEKDCMFVIPCYRVQTEERGSGFIPQIVARIQCLMYRQMFYIPQINDLKESIARFDRIQVVVNKAPAAISPTNTCLSEAVFGLFLSLFLFCMSGKTNDDLEAVKELVREAYPEA